MEELLGYVVPFYLEPGDSDDAKGGTVEQYMLVAGQVSITSTHMLQTGGLEAQRLFLFDVPGVFLCGFVTEEQCAQCDQKRDR